MAHCRNFFCLFPLCGKDRKRVVLLVDGFLWLLLVIFSYYYHYCEKRLTEKKHRVIVCEPTILSYLFAGLHVRGTNDLTGHFSDRGPFSSSSWYPVVAYGHLANAP